jgi:methyl-accepting chemotaxis protein
MSRIRLSVRAKLFGSSALLLVLTAVVGLLAIRALGSVNEKGRSMYTDRTVPIAQLGAVSENLTDNQRLSLRGIVHAGRASVQREVDAAIGKNMAENGELLDAYAATALVPAEERAVQELRTLLADYRESLDETRGHARAGAAEAAEAANERTLEHWRAARAQLDELIRLNEAEARRLAGEIASTYARDRNLSLAVLALAIGLGLFVSWLVARGIVGGVRTVLVGAEAVGGGDLTHEVEVDSRDELGALGAAFRAMTENLRELVGAVGTTATQLGSASQQMASSSEEAGKAVGEIASAVGDVAQGAERQLRMVESARQLTQEMAAAVTRGAENASGTRAAAQQARAIADEGVASVEEATAAMTAVRSSSEDVSVAIRSLSEKSGRIGGIVETITGIAGQTNLLALNAAIEAARAGEQGKGFAVVAEEVRKLAEESQRAAASIAELIGEIQVETEHVVAVVEDGAARTEVGAETVERARDAFQRIGGAVEDMTARVEEIAAAIDEIAAHAERVQTDMNEVAAVAQQSSASSQEVSASTEQTSASAQEIAASAQELASTAEQLNGLISRFRVSA